MLPSFLCGRCDHREYCSAIFCGIVSSSVDLACIMAGRPIGGGSAMAVFLALASLLQTRGVADALAGAPMELTSQALAETPAGAEGPAEGPGPSIIRSKQLPQFSRKQTCDYDGNPLSSIPVIM